jgi:hypothetical protein
MREIVTNFIKWLANKLGFKIAMIRQVVGEVNVQGDPELVRYVDLLGYINSRKPLSRLSDKKSNFVLSPQSKDTSVRLPDEIVDTMLEETIREMFDHQIEKEELQDIMKVIKEKY